MLIIRLTRVGRRNQPSFRIVLTEKQAPIKGRFIEILGHWNPRLKTKSFKKERILHWLSKGVKLSPTVHNLLVNEKIIEEAKVKAWRPKKKKVKEVKEEKTETLKEGALKEEVKELKRDKEQKAKESELEKKSETEEKKEEEGE